MMTVRLQRAVIENYKGIERVEVETSERLTCILGENASGKTTILEALSGQISRHYYGELQRNIELNLSVSVRDVEELVELGIHEVEISLSQDDNQWDYSFKEISGIERFLDNLNKNLMKSKEKYDSHIKRIYDFLLEMRKKLEKLPVEELKELNSGIFSFKTEDIDYYIDKFKRYLTNSEELVYDIVNEIELPNHRVHLSYHGDRIFNDRLFDRFKYYAKLLTIKNDSRVCDVEGMTEYYNELKELFNEFVLYTNTYSERFFEESKKAEKPEGEYIDTINLAREIKQLIFQKAIKYIRNCPFISSSYHNDFRIDSNMSDKQKQYLGILGFDINQIDSRKLSDGEKWMISLTGVLSSEQSDLIFIDEPGMFVNPLIQKEY